MKKIFCVFLSFFIFSTGVLASTIVHKFTTTQEKYIIDIDGSLMSTKLPIMSFENNTYIPLREFGESLGYSVKWIPNEQKILLTGKDKKTLPFYQSMDQSSEGELSNGTKYYYNASEDSQLYSIESWCKQTGATEVISEYGEVPSAKMAAELGQVILGCNTNNVIQVQYEKSIDAWVVIALTNTTSHAGARTAVIRRSNGGILKKYEVR